MSFRESEIRKNAFIYSHFDSVIFNESNFVDELTNSLNGYKKLDANDNSGVVEVQKYTVPENTSSFHSVDYHTLIGLSSYFDFINLPLDKCIFSTRLSRNPCYWKKCTFCVQNNKHLSDGPKLKESEEVNRSLNVLKTMYDLGCRVILYSDEAVSPKNIGKLCDYIANNAMPLLKWTVRTTADVKFGESIVKKMRDTGCIEVLLGLETVSNNTAKSMNKCSQMNNEDEIYSLMERFSEHKVGVYLNLIYMFPTETDEGFVQSYNFYRKINENLDGITIQFNKFALFYGSDVFNNPENYQLEYVEPIDSFYDLKVEFEYRDKFGRGSSTLTNIEYDAASISMKVSEYTNLVKAHGSGFVTSLFQVNYASFGLLHKAETNDDLFAYIMESHG
ncbi:MAG: radical SAM protein [Gammaproteobacteria bacterium]|nr:radical SAM protein [Gammaproteobacteria bacterium]